MSKGVVISLVIIALGVAWLLNTLNVFVSVDWIWTVSLALSGLLVLTVLRFNKLTFVVGSFLLAGSIFSILRQTGVMSLEIEVPLLMVLFGVLFLAAQHPLIPSPRIPEPADEEAKQKV